jgi:large subunit ribosomal protein L31
MEVGTLADAESIDSDRPLKELESMAHHPETHLIDAVCANCGSRFALRSTASSIAVDVCSNCHPAYTGVAHTSARGSRVDRFNRRRALATA